MPNRSFNREDSRRIIEEIRSVQKPMAPELSSGDGANGNPELMAPISRAEAERKAYEVDKKRSEGSRQHFFSGRMGSR